MNELRIRNTFKNAWSRLHGSKKSIWSIAVLVILISATIEYFSKWLFLVDSTAFHYWARYIIVPIIMSLLIGPFYGGSLMVAIQCARGESINIKSGYEYFHRYSQAAILMAIIALASNLMVIILNIPSVAESVGLSMPYFDLLGALFSFAIYSLFVLSIPLAIDKNKSVSESLIESIKIIKPHWLRVFFIFFLAYLVLFIFYVPIVLGLSFSSATITIIGVSVFVFFMIWFLPFLFLLGGEIYHQLVD